MVMGKAHVFHVGSLSKEYKSDLAEQAEAIIRKEYRLEMRH